MTPHASPRDHRIARADRGAHLDRNPRRIERLVCVGDQRAVRTERYRDDRHAPVDVLPRGIADVRKRLQLAPDHRLQLKAVRLDEIGTCLDAQRQPLALRVEDAAAAEAVHGAKKRAVVVLRTSGRKRSGQHEAVRVLRVQRHQLGHPLEIGVVDLCARLVDLGDLTLLAVEHLDVCAHAALAPDEVVRGRVHHQALFKQLCALFVHKSNALRIHAQRRCRERDR